MALREVDPFTLLTLRFGIGGFLLLLVQLLRNRGFLETFSSKDWIAIIFLAIVGISGHTLLQAYGLLYTTAVNTGWIVAIIPIFITIAARLFLGEAITARKLIGILIGFLGIFLVISKGVFSVSIFRFGSTFGDILVLISALTWTAFTVGGKGFLSRFSPLAAITPIMIVGCLITLPFTWLKWEWNILFHLSLTGWMSILFLGVFCSGLAYLFWYSALEKKDSSIVGMYLYLEPLVTLIGAYFLLNEEIRLGNPCGRRDDPPRRLPGHKEVSVPGPSISVCCRQALRQGREVLGEIKFLTSKLISDIKCRCGAL